MKTVILILVAWHMVVALFVLPTMFVGGQTPEHLKTNPMHQYAEWLLDTLEGMKK